MTTISTNRSKPIIDPLKFAKRFWPHVTFYKQQKEIIYSVVKNDETIVPAGNELGKDFVSAFIALWFFLTKHPVRVITTSVAEKHLDVLWGEIDRFISSSVIPLEQNRGGPLVYNHMMLRKMINYRLDKHSYCKGMVSEKGEGLSGHHAPHTLLIIDEASGVDQAVYDMGIAWAKRILVIGNPNPCHNFFYKGVKEGDRLSKKGDRFYRKVIKIRAKDSPNVRFAESELAHGMEPTDRILVPGVKNYAQYIKDREMWDEMRQCIGLDAEFYEGKESLLFPPDWLTKAEELAIKLKASGMRRRAKAMGVDPAEGGDDTAWSIIDEYGLLHQLAMKTPDTTVITDRTIALMRDWQIDPLSVCFDRGGGGHPHADRLRRQGYPVRTVAFGESLTPDPKHGITTIKAQIAQREEKYVCVNRRAEMYHDLSLRLDPTHPVGFAIPAEYAELRRQLAPIPRLYDEEGRLYLPPKNKKDPKSTKKTMIELIGCSPDEADSLVLALHAMTHKTTKVVAGRSMI